MSSRLNPTALAVATLAVFALSGLSAHAAPPAPLPAAPTAGVLVPPVAEGRVLRLLINPYGEVDGLQLADQRIVKFAPHMGAALASAVQPGQTVRVAGRIELSGAIKADAITTVDTGRVTVDAPPLLGRGAALPPHLRAQSLQPLQAEGRVATVLNGRRGEVNGVILDSGAIVRFAPHALPAPVLPGQAFAASGLGTRTAHGTALEAVRIGPTLETLQPLYREPR